MAAEVAPAPAGLGVDGIAAAICEPEDGAGAAGVDTGAFGAGVAGGFEEEDAAAGFGCEMLDFAFLKPQ